MVFCLGQKQAQQGETYVLNQAVSNRETIVYTRLIRFDNQKRLFHAQDYYENGQVQMDAVYFAFDDQWIHEPSQRYRPGRQEDCRPVPARFVGPGPPTEGSS
jgi:hypothetical protein